MARPKKQFTSEQLVAKAKAHSAYVSEQSRKAHESNAEISPLPPVKNPKRKAACRRNLFKFLSTYFPNSTSDKPFSEDHRRMIQRIQNCVLHGGRFNNLVYRGAAKSTISENSAIWATVYGHRQFVALFATSMDESTQMIESIKKELAENDMLTEDFPEVCYPLSRLEWKPQRAPHQTLDGKKTNSIWKADMIVLPTVPKSKASGAIIRAKPFTKPRGMKFKRDDGNQVRPDFAIIDDPQDDETANSPISVRKNLRLLRSAILPAGGHKKRLSVVINATVIARDDMVDQLSKDRSWQTERIPMVKQWAKSHESFWMDRYATTRRNYDASVIGSQEEAERNATELYRKNRGLADDGCIVSWDHCYGSDDGELSAIQHAYNLLIDLGEESFASECQQNPKDPAAENRLLTPALVRSKANGIDRGFLPRYSEMLTIYIDVHLEILYWMATAWSQHFAAHVVDYGTWPKQSNYYFVQRAPGKPLSSFYPSAVGKGAIHAGITDLVEHLAKRSWIREDSGVIYPSIILLDSKWESDVVESYCLRSEFKNIVMPAKGFYVGPETTWNDYFSRKGEGQTGYHTRCPPPKNGMRYLLIDADEFKELSAKGLSLSTGTPGCWTIFGRPDDPGHVLLSDHCCAENRAWITKGDRGKFHWDNPPGKDNHWWDCLAGSAAGASYKGAVVPGNVSRAKRSRREAEMEFMAKLKQRGVI